jgi:acyl-CoA reductase-like NAD-dependent aldehyde dehydrogenase
VNWKASAAAVRWNIQPFINGCYRRSNSAEFFDNINPATETTLCSVPVGQTADVDEAVSIARERFNDGCWSELSPTRRAEILFKFADLIVRHKEQLALLDTLEMGKPIADALHDAGVFAPMLLRSWAGFADKLFGRSAPLRSGTLSFNTYEPRGVIGAIAPWNFPVVNAVVKLGPALATGNSVVLKPSELTSSSALKLAELALEAGVPEGVLNVVPGLGSTVGEALALHRDVDLLSFTGSTATGRKIMELSGRSNGKPILLECGGKSPQLVFGDVRDLDTVADVVVNSALYNQGQVCNARTRLIVQEEIKDRLLDRVISRTKMRQAGDPLEETTTSGSLASPAQRERVKGYIKQGKQAGAEPVLEGTIQMSGGCYVMPTIFDRVEDTMSIVREEIFGPVLCIQTFKTEADAIMLANRTDYGLAATVWTGDTGCGMRMAHSIKAGAVSIRASGKEESDSSYILGHEPQRASGFGSELGIEGLKAYSTLKLISLSAG